MTNNLRTQANYTTTLTLLTNERSSGAITTSRQKPAILSEAYYTFQFYYITYSMVMVSSKFKWNYLISSWHIFQDDVDMSRPRVSVRLHPDPREELHPSPWRLRASGPRCGRHTPWTIILKGSYRVPFTIRTHCKFLFFGHTFFIGRMPTTHSQHWNTGKPGSTAVTKQNTGKF